MISTEKTHESSGTLMEGGEMAQRRDGNLMIMALHTKINHHILLYTGRTPLAAGEAREETSDSNKNHLISDRGIPLQDPNHDLPLEAFNEALGEVREVMLQYTSTADPTENAARRERVRQAEKQGQLEETAARIVRSSLANHAELQPTDANVESPGRIPALLRLGPPSPAL
ncbi:hypothetical protein F2Q69_00039643 [Brassica cretica]|uniref:Uncharacterized protein n=1 Tax=Brassica cretica TaxID=69181 RepID=A0A8S9NNQ2_BRACR|nr:hypothetical protein F2Q69_00039643 [Brassica cretica]